MVATRRTGVAPCIRSCTLFSNVSQKTVEMIDLYGDARLTGKKLVAFKRMLVESRSLAEMQPDGKSTSALRRHRFLASCTSHPVETISCTASNNLNGSPRGRKK